MKPLEGQIDETIELCRQRVEKGERVLVTTLTKRTAEDLTDYLRGVDLKVRYIHADIDAIERVEILRALRAAEFDILVGINLLREGLDLPEVSLVCILDADKEGFLRSETSLIQTAGRAARHVNGEVVLFCRRRHRLDPAPHQHHRIPPRAPDGIQREARHHPAERGARGSGEPAQASAGKEVERSLVDEGDDLDALEVIRELEEEMQEAAQKLEFERAALIRDQLNELKKEAGQPLLKVKRKKVRYK